MKSRNLTLMDLTHFLSEGPAKLCGLDKHKGSLTIGMDADFVVWDPKETIEVSIFLGFVEFLWRNSTSLKQNFSKIIF